VDPPSRGKGPLAGSGREEAVGRKGGAAGGCGDVFTVSGGSENFNFDGMQGGPRGGRDRHRMVIGGLPFLTRYFSFRCGPGRIALSMQALQKKEGRRLMPGAPFEYKFMDRPGQGLYLIFRSSPVRKSAFRWAKKTVGLCCHALCWGS